MFIRQIKYQLFFSSFFRKIFIWVLVRIGFEQKKDGLKEAQDLSLAPYDR